MMRSREGRLALLLAVFAGLRVLLFSATFPFFTNIDEHRHVDVVLKYDRGYLPAPGNDAYEREMGAYLALYGSPEYHLPPRIAAPPPGWRGPRGALMDRIVSQEAFLAKRHNLEANEPPVYYALCAAWMKLGRAIGASGGALLYWLRALNALATAALVLIAYVSLRALHPDAFVRLGVPLLLAVFPQDSVYYVTRDAISPLVMGVAFLWVLRFSSRPDLHALEYAGAGATLAAAFLVKYTNLAALAVAVAVTGMALAARPAARSLRGEGGRWLLFWAVALIPIGAWLVRNQILFGDLTGSALKTERMGWGRNSIAEMWDHMLLTPSGTWAFVRDLVPSFWRGQLAWHRELLASGAADFFYTASSLLFVALAAVGLRRRTEAGSPRAAAQQLEGMALIAVLVSVGTLAGLSLLFVFHENSNPSAAKPYFDQGRLISGMLVPFAILYVRGIQVATSRLADRPAALANYAVLFLVAAIAATSELSLTWPVFSSAYNWFHLP